MFPQVFPHLTTSRQSSSDSNQGEAKRQRTDNYPSLPPTQPFPALLDMASPMPPSYSMLGYGAPQSGAAAIPRYGYIRQPVLRVPNDGNTLLRYGRSWKSASQAQKANRAADRYFGRGRYRRYRKRRRGLVRRRRRRWRGRGLYHGRGGFWGDLWKATKTPLLNVAQAGLGAIPVVGSDAASAFSKLRTAGGWGSYETRSNQLVSGAGNQFEAPSFSEVDDTGAITISHREFIGNVYGPSAGKPFETQTWDLNPGIEQTFPWLAQIAANYEEYEIKQLMFTFKTTVANFQTTSGVTGTVLTATQYDPHSRPFTDLNTMLQTFGGSSCKATENLISGVECDPAKLAGAPGKYIRTADIPSNRDLKDYDLGRFVLALADFPNQLVDEAIGQLWVSYTVTLRRPRVYTGRGDAISRDAWYLAVQQGDPGADATFNNPVTSVMNANSWNNQPASTGSPVYTFPGPAQPIPPGGGSLVNAAFIWDQSAVAYVYKNAQNNIGVSISKGTPRGVAFCRQFDATGTQTTGFSACIVDFGIASATGNAAVPTNSDPVTLTMATNQHELASHVVASSAIVKPHQAPTAAGDVTKAETATRNAVVPVRVTFPARFSGNVCIKLVQASTKCETYSCHTSAQGNVVGIFDITSGIDSARTVCRRPSRGTEGASPVVVDAFPADYPSRVYPDLAAISSNMSTCLHFSRGDGGLNLGSIVSMELHVHVEPASDGQDNFVELAFVQARNFTTGTTGPISQIRNTFLTVEEYNATQTDLKDTPTIINAQSDQPLLQDRSNVEDLEDL